MAQYVTIGRRTDLDGEDLTTPTSYRAEINNRGWDRYIKIAIFEVQRTAGIDELGTVTGNAFEFDGDTLDISFSVNASMDSSSTGGLPSASVTLKNLNSDTQWSIKKYMRITINAGYKGDKNNGLVFSGQITNIKDSYESDGSITLELSCVAMYESKQILVSTIDYKAGTPFTTIVEDVCSMSGIPLNACEFDGTCALDTARTFQGSVKDVIDELINMANNKLVQNNPTITKKDISNGKGYTMTTDRSYIEILKDGGEKGYAIAFNATNGLISVNREDIVSDSALANKQDIVTIDATIQFNWRIRLSTAVSITSFKQPHLSGVYQVYSYEMNGSSKNGSHDITMSLIPVQGFANDIVDLSSKYTVSYTQGPTDS